jgi:ribose transport system ATP-binding protein
MMAALESDIAAGTAFLSMEGITKRYGGVTALDDVHFACQRHSIHAILGENGAGKSTLIKIVAGVTRADTGRMVLEGKEIMHFSPADATRAGIVCIFQELSLMPDLSVADNICITNPPGRGGLINQRAQRQRAEALLAQVGCEDVNPITRVRDLPLSRRQLVEIAKALGRAPKLLILDEATSALTAADVEKVFTILRTLREQGTPILYISHRMAEIEAIADQCTVFRNSRYVETFKQGERSHEQIVQLMIGREISQIYPPKRPHRTTAEPALVVENLGWEDRLNGISFSIAPGEIVGLGGLDGQGQREVLLGLFGVLRGLKGTVKLNGRNVTIRSPATAKLPKNAIAMIPEDRKTEGLMLPMSIRDNLSIASLKRFVRAGVINRSLESTRVDAMIEAMRIKIGAPTDPVGTLSGGNQQKVVIGKWLMTEAKVLLLMDPTRGIDVGTKQEIYALMRRLADDGAAILFYSTDYDELIGMCDRISILYRGEIVRTLVGDDITEQNIVAASLNVDLGARVSPDMGARHG